MKRKIKLYFYEYKYFMIGLIVAVIGYFYSLYNNLDVFEYIGKYLTLTEKYELDEAIFIWALVFLFFAILNIISFLIRKKESQKRKVYRSMLYANNHIIKNLLYQIQILRMEAKKDPNFDNQVIRMFDNSIEEAQILVDNLSKIKKIDSKDIYDSIKPLAAK
ncbi:hypothetical protein [Aquimarina latercula]|uniref:hypothetical protein n=1 Tax=Aquimarina latercula TaxID=987 RepID=UPI00055525FD|nr:hypothetical protein [Aquimarina latercula]